MKRPGFSRGEPEFLYRRDSPWISSYHIQNSFQLDITDIQHQKSLHRFIYYITLWVVVRKSEYKPLGLKESKQKSKAVAILLGKLHLDASSPQAARSVARTILSFILRLRAWFASRILHLPDYPQGRDRFTSPSVWKLYVDAKRYKSSQRIGWGFLWKHIYLYRSPITHRHGPYRHRSSTKPRLVQEIPLLCTSADSTGGSGLEEGRNQGLLL